MLIDIHTHKKSENESINQIALIDNVHFVGLHPWFIKEDYQQKWNEIKLRHLEEQIPLIGETGLDRLKSDVDINLQLEVFKLHLELSNQLNRPLVIHCLRAHSDFLGLLKQLNFKQKFIIHDFSGGEKELKEYLKYNAYFSFGKSIFREKSKAQMVFSKAPINRIFLETDDDQNLTILKVYEEAQKLLNRTDLEEKILSNFLEFFNYTDNLRPADFIKNIC